MNCYLGIDLGGTNIAVGVVDLDGKILFKASEPTDSKRSFEDVVKNMVELSKMVLSKAGFSQTDIDFVGMGVPSTIEPKTQKVVFANNLGWKDRDVVAEFHKHWDIPVRIENDADCAALGELSGEDVKKYDNSLMITLGTGVGGGLIMGKKIFRGCDGTGFEPGHTIICYNGLDCTCGCKGCYEAYSSVTALIRQTKDKMQVSPDSKMWQACSGSVENVTGRTAFDAAHQGDKPANEVVEQFIDYVSVGIANIVTMFRPDIVIIGGGISEQDEYLLKPLREKVKEKTYASDIIGVPPIIKAKLGNDAGIIGAAMLNG